MKGRVRFCDRSVLISFVYGYYDERSWEGLGPPGGRNTGPSTTEGRILGTEAKSRIESAKSIASFDIHK